MSEEAVQNLSDYISSHAEGLKAIFKGRTFEEFMESEEGQKIMEKRREQRKDIL